MSNTKIELRKLQITDLKQVAEIHTLAFPNSALTHLGIDPICRYYEWQITGPHDCFAIGAFEKNLLVGYCFSGVFRGSLSGFLNKNKKLLIKRILTHPWLILNSLIFDRIKIALRTLKNTGLHKETAIPVTPSFGILSIATDPSQQGKGIARQLMTEVEIYASQQGFKTIHLTVHPTNEQAVNFYVKSGWIKRINEAGNWTGSMEKILSDAKP